MLDLARAYSDLNYFTSQLNVKKANLMTAKENNKRVNKIKADFVKVQELEHDLSAYVRNLELFYKLVSSESANYKQRRLDFLSNYIDENIKAIFPHEGYKTKIHVDFKNKSGKAYLKIIDKNGKVGLPSVSSGKMLQQLISFSSAIGIAECLGMNKFYMDEAFAASDMENLTKVGLLLKKILEEDFQVLLIEQKDDIYKDLPRREIHIKKDVITGEIRVDDITDY